MKGSRGKKWVVHLDTENPRKMDRSRDPGWGKGNRKVRHRQEGEPNSGPNWCKAERPNWKNHRKDW